MLIKTFVRSLLKNWKGLIGLALIILAQVACVDESASQPSPSQQTQPSQPPMEIAIRISSDLEGGKCLSAGESFYLVLQMEGIPQEFEGPRRVEVIFEVGPTENGKVWVLNTTQEIKFQLATDEKATGSIMVVFSLPDGSTIEYGNPTFPYFHYVGEREGKYCFGLPFGPRPNSPLRRA